MNKKPLGKEESIPTHLDALFFKLQQHWRNKQLNKLYNNYCQEPDLNDKYIYYAAGYHPEAISNLTPGVYEDPLLILDTLSSAVPEDWRIYYKEHPHTFIDLEKGVLQRTEEYYKKINEYNNVSIISTSKNTFDLIDNSMAVATAGGTVGWEAMVRGVPALLFGNLWYQPCKSVFSIKTFNDALDAISKVRAGFIPDPSDIERYAQSIYMSCEKDLLAPHYTDEKIKSCDDVKYEMGRIAKAIYCRYTDYYSVN